jgi:hypothetical protein
MLIINFSYVLFLISSNIYTFLKICTSLAQAGMLLCFKVRNCETQNVISIHVIERGCKRGLFQHKNMKFPCSMPPPARKQWLPKWTVYNLKMVVCGVKTERDVLLTFDTSGERMPVTIFVVACS